MENRLLPLQVAQNVLPRLKITKKYDGSQILEAITGGVIPLESSLLATGICAQAICRQMCGPKNPNFNKYFFCTQIDEKTRTATLIGKPIDTPCSPQVNSNNGTI